MSDARSVFSRFAWRQSLRAHLGFIVLLFCAAVLLFTNLGKDALWNDEGDSVFWARSIRKNGIPKAWDGREFSNEDTGAMTTDLVMVTLPWLPLYATTASFSIFGESTWVARLPFALAGLLTVFTVYLWVLRQTGNRQTAVLAALLLLLTVQFLLFARSCRYYSFTMLFASLGLLFFQRLDRPRYVWLFAGSVILLFYSMPLPALCLLAGVGSLTVLYSPFQRFRRPFFISLLLIIPLIVPWLILMHGRTSSFDTGVLASVSALTRRSFQMMIESMFVAPYLAWVVLFFIGRRNLSKDEISLLLLCATVSAVLITADVLIHTARQMFSYGTRHYCALIPLAAMMSATLVQAVARRNRFLAASAVLLLIFTHFGGNTLPWLFLQGTPPDETHPDRVDVLHSPHRRLYKLVRAELAGYFLDLYKPNPGTVSEVSAYLNANAGKDDLVLTNYEWEAFYFHTGLAQAGKVDKGDPVYSAAQKHHLPEYVFEPGLAKWMIWRPIWGDYLKGIEKAEAARASWNQRGLSAHPVARFKETMCENRPEITFHRFPVLGQIYVPETKIAETIVLVPQAPSSKP